ncbi:endoglucanase-like [Anthonomus grandis grandis]|uniref:endoglucanase-like n=1 Tax=Anthonomus grandis grandis TaxID=2921223 RepID=UPI002165505A|nr:endoglucanase-like [Anthonomus grandis grandis]
MLSVFFKMSSLFIALCLATYALAETSPDIVPIPNGISGDGLTTRYWDCCKPSCGWSYQTNQKKAVLTCDIDGVTPVNDSVQSGCAEDYSGNAFTCNNQQPWIVNSTLSYGFVAASFTGGVDNSHCCHCLLLNFKGDLAGKSLLALITNTGEPLAQNQFDIEIPGGGVGIYPLGCYRQWGADPEQGWGEAYGGISTQDQCSELPSALQPGCNWRWDFMEGVSNPSVSFYQVECPKELIDIAQCERDDE